MPVPRGSSPDRQTQGLRPAAAQEAQEVPTAGAAPGYPLPGNGGGNLPARPGAGMPPARPAAAEGPAGLPALAEWSFDKGGCVSPADGREGKDLLPLLLEESQLLANYGPEHPAVMSVRERINVVRKYLEQHPPPAPPGPGPNPPPALPARAPVADQGTRGRETKIELFPVTVVLLAGRQRPEAGEGAGRRVLPAREVGGKVPRPADAVPTSPAPAEQHAQSARYLSGIPRWQLLGAGLFLAGLLAHVAALRAFLRWYGRRLARRIRAELEAEGPGHVDAGAPDGAPPARAGAGPGPWATTGPAAAGAGVCRTGEPSGTDLGDGEESPGRAPAEAGPGVALLRQVFEDNLRLREQLGRLPA
jgi:hypothetical protein